jgi:hypothetical protein
MMIDQMLPEILSIADFLEQQIRWLNAWEQYLQRELETVVGQENSYGGVKALAG